MVPTHSIWLISTPSAAHLLRTRWKARWMTSWRPAPISDPVQGVAAAGDAEGVGDTPDPDDTGLRLQDTGTCSVSLAMAERTSLRIWPSSRSSKGWRQRA